MTDTSIRQFVEDLAARTPTPGGGAAAAQAGAMGIALMTMVIRFSRGKRETAAREAELDQVEQDLAAITERVLPMVERDMASFERVAAAYKLPKGSDDEKLVRSRAIQEALQGAMVVPEELIHLLRDCFALMHGVADCVGRNIGADLGTATALIYAGARSGELMVRTNASYLADREQARLISGRCEQLMLEIRQHREALAERAQVLTQ